MINQLNLGNYYELILDSLPMLVFFKDKENRFLYVNKYVADAYKKTKNELINTNLYDIYDYEIAKKYHDDDLEVINSGNSKIDIEEKWITEIGYEWVNTSKIPIANEHGEIVGVLGLSYNITDRKHKDELIEKLIRRIELEKTIAIENSFIDGLTHIYNRKYIDNNLIIEIERAKRKKEIISIAMIDIDYFKKYNDLYGHLEGDECLKLIAKILKDSIFRSSDFVARYGGEEFLLVLPDTNSDGLKAVLDRIAKKIKDSKIEHAGSEVSSFLSLSIGAISALPNETTNVLDLIKKADNELYDVKNNGRNNFKINTIDEIIDKSGFLEIKWKKEYCSGNAIIDNQHINLIRKANDLILLYRNRNIKKCNIIENINNIFIDLHNHFIDEERILEKCLFEDLINHSKIHKDILEKGHIMLNKKNVNCETILKYIVFDVILDHMEIEDSKFFKIVSET